MPVELRAAVALLCLLPLGGCGGRSDHAAIQLKLTVTSYHLTAKTTRTFNLDCEPTSGTLPFAGRVCADIARHPQAMLAPRPQRSTCIGGPSMPTVEVDVLRGTRGGGPSGSPGCDWPGGTPLSIYYAASTRDEHLLRLMEPRLRCEDDPALFAKPTPWASVAACTHGLWTPRAERTIRLAKRSAAIAGFATLFPRDPGVVRCRIPAGGPQTRILHGLCGVSLTGPASRKTVHVVESWTVAGHAFRHRWVIRGSRLVAQGGAVPPQLWM